MNFNFFKQIGESETKMLWYLSSIGGKTSTSLDNLSKLISIDPQQLRRTTNRLQEKGFIKKYRGKPGPGSVNTYELVRQL